MKTLENKIEQGKFIEIPIEIGKSVFILPCYLRNKEITEYEILSYLFSGRGLFIELTIKNVVSGLERFISMNVNSIGELIFKTREEAEKMLEELKK